MEEWQRIIANLFVRLDGPLHFRIVVQPTMAVIFAVVDGISDAKAGHPAYFWAMISNPEHRKTLIQSGWKRVGKIFVLAIVLDVVSQRSVIAFTLVKHSLQRSYWPSFPTFCSAV